MNDYSKLTGKYLNYQDVEEVLGLEEGFFSQYQKNFSELVSLKIVKD